MKLMLGNTPVKKMMIHNDTQDATMVASDLQAGVTCYAKGQKVTGTGKCFEFARYGSAFTNVATVIPHTINVITIGSLNYPVQLSASLKDMKNLDFSTSQSIGSVVVDGTSYPISVIVSNGKITISCDKTIKLEIFYGKDNYV